MRRLVRLAALVAAVVVLVVRYPSAGPESDAAPVADHTPHLVAARLGHVQSPPQPVFTRTMYEATGLNRSSEALDACHGPVAVDLGRGWPVLVAEHDYCGGSAWVPRLEQGDTVQLDGEGVDDGLYVVSELRYQLRGKGRVSDLPDGAVVLQTCVSEKKMVLVGLEKWSPVGA